MRNCGWRLPANLIIRNTRCRVAPFPLAPFLWLRHPPQQNLTGQVCLWGSENGERRPVLCRVRLICRAQVGFGFSMADGNLSFNLHSLKFLVSLKSHCVKLERFLIFFYFPSFQKQKHNRNTDPFFCHLIQRPVQLIAMHWHNCVWSSLPLCRSAALSTLVTCVFFLVEQQWLWAVPRALVKPLIGIAAGWLGVQAVSGS